MYVAQPHRSVYKHSDFLQNDQVLVITGFIPIFRIRRRVLETFFFLSSLTLRIHYFVIYSLLDLSECTVQPSSCQLRWLWQSPFSLRP